LILTPRESEVLQLVSEGRTNKEIAAMLRVSIKTINSHIYEIYRRNGCHNRVQAVRMAQQQGLVARV
jgi:DNA-binding CsgD family transcriptional regulator